MVYYRPMLPLALFAFISFHPLKIPSAPSKEPQVSVVHAISLTDRYPNKIVNDVFKDNILLSLAYLKGDVSNPKDINWEKLRKPNHFQFTLHPNQTFAFHDSVLPQYQNKVALTSHSHFNYQEGFKSDGYLYGDGVCHLASLFNWTAKDAGLQVNSPINHDFMPIPEIPKSFGTAIFYNPAQTYASENQNLYITNNKGKDITFDITSSNDGVEIQVIE